MNLLKSFKSCLVLVIKLSDLFFKVNFWNIWINVHIKHSVPQGISPTLKYWPEPSLPSPSPHSPQNSKSVRPLLYEQPPPPQNFAEIDSSPLLRCTLVQESKDSFFKQKILFPTMKWEHIWTFKYEYTVAKSKNRWRIRLLLSILFLLGS